MNRRVSILILLALSITIYVGTSGWPPLLDSSDAGHAEAAREMLQSHNWVILHIDGIRYLEKPSLHYWLVAASYEVFGVSAFSTRLPLAIFVVALVLMVYFFGRRWFGERAGFYAALLLGDARVGRGGHLLLVDFLDLFEEVVGLLFVGLTRGGVGFHVGLFAEQEVEIGHGVGVVRIQLNRMLEILHAIVDNRACLRNKIVTDGRRERVEFPYRLFSLQIVIGAQLRVCAEGDPIVDDANPIIGRGIAGLNLDVPLVVG
ncbi:MAG TPA: glycosyltransferase family 39 protein, partial [Terriglobia bacterium]|nr:glycosyltransferase family 39 protein [Terriglobia bacterium]